MRFLLLALMIALLPLRGWVGDAMAMQMVNPALQAPGIATVSIAPRADMAGHEAEIDVHHAAMTHADCPGHASRADVPMDSLHQTEGADCATCALCQICHTVALTPVSLHIAAALLPAAQPQTSSHLFASAERAPGFKPPIF